MKYLPDDFPLVAGTPDLAEILGVSTETIRRHARHQPGSLPHAFKIGNGPRARLCFHRYDVEKWMSERLARPQKKSGPSTLDAA